MSLDVYLRIPDKTEVVDAKIYIRENGQNKSITFDEWNARYPDREPIYAPETVSDTVFDYNITHNLNRMAAEAGLYDCMWRPDEHDMRHARDLIGPLRRGLETLASDQERFAAFNPENGWGDYAGLVDFAKAYLLACEKWPDAEVTVSR